MKEDSSVADSDYIIRCWNEFTSLTAEEWENLEKIKSLYAPPKIPKVPKTKPRRKVECLDTGEVFNSLRECCNKLELNYSNLSSHCSKGFPKTVKNKRFRYLPLNS